MRRLLFISLVFVTACLSGGTAPSDISQIQVGYDGSPLGVFAGDQVQLTAEALDAAGDLVPAAFTYSSSNHAVATVDANGLITAVGAGTTTIAVATPGFSQKLAMTVDGNVTKSVQVTPTAATVAPGISAQLTATVFTTLGNPARGKTLAWTSGDVTKVSVDPTGTYTGVAATPGVSVCASSTDAPAIQGCATITVQPPASAALHR